MAAKHREHFSKVDHSHQARRTQLQTVKSFYSSSRKKKNFYPQSLYQITDLMEKTSLSLIICGKSLSLYIYNPLTLVKPSILALLLLITVHNNKLFQLVHNHA